MTRNVLLAILLSVTVYHGVSASDAETQDGNPQLWSFQPITNPPIPAVDPSLRVKNPIDHFIFSKLNKHGLRPADETDPQSAIRRVTYNLTGLPPTPEEIQSFTQDSRPDSWERLLDRLLARPHYGERWGRHWLDVVRYADTTASDGNFVMRYAWRYRNYVIDAFNQDLPYDEFIVEQLAGDLLPKSANNDLSLRRVIATGFLMLGPKSLAEADKEQVRMDMVDEQIDVTGRAFLGTTLACARCHDHKFDPISTADYYSLAGIFRSLELLQGNSGVTAMWYEGEVQRDSTQLKLKYEKVAKELATHLAAIQKLESEPVEGQEEWEKSLATEANENSDRSSTVKSPDELDELHAWYQASSIQPAADQRVARWPNRAGDGLDLVATSDEKTAPTLHSSALNGHPVVVFGEKEHLLQTETPFGISGNQAYSIFIVINPRSAAADRNQLLLWGNSAKPAAGSFLEIDSLDLDYERLDLGTGVNYDAASGAISMGVPQIWSVRYDGGVISGHRISINGHSQTVTATGEAATTKLNTVDHNLVVGGIGMPETKHTVSPAMDIAEILIYRQFLDDEQEHLVGAWLAMKYHLLTDYLDMTSQLASLPPSKRTAVQQQHLRIHFLKQQHREYRERQKEVKRLTAHKTSLEAQRLAVKVMFPKEDGGRNLRIHRRGNRFDLGEETPRRVPLQFADENRVTIDTSQSGRLELARWIANPGNPLTARVMANRIWQHHFGRGLVATSDNFGEIGQRPTHPRLLDWLAHKFIASGWSIKTMHRRLLASATYRQSSSLHPMENPTFNNAQSTDPDNKLLWRYPRRRLEAEAIRDAILAVSGRLDRQLGGGEKAIMQLYNGGDAVDAKLGLVSAANVSFDYSGYQIPRRSIYLPVIRNAQPEILSVFDSANTNAVTPIRHESIVSSQALFLLNNPTIRDQSMHLARRLLVMDTIDDTHRIQTVWRLAFSRDPSDNEIRDGHDFIREYIGAAISAGLGSAPARDNAWQSFCQMIFCMNEFIYVH